MSDQDSEDYKRAVEREARRGRTFSIADRVGKEGAGFFAGESPVPRLEQATLQLCQFVEQHVSDASGALRIIVQRQLKTSETLVGEHLDDPFAALERLLARWLSRDEALCDFVREVDAEWGRLMLERPLFQKLGEPPEEGDEYTLDSVRVQLESLLAIVRARC
jgi:hypothetical protein